MTEAPLTQELAPLAQPAQATQGPEFGNNCWATSSMPLHSHHRYHGHHSVPGGESLPMVPRRRTAHQPCMVLLLLVTPGPWLLLLLESHQESTVLYSTQIYKSCLCIHFWDWSELQPKLCVCHLYTSFCASPGDADGKNLPGTMTLDSKVAVLQNLWNIFHRNVTANGPESLAINLVVAWKSVVQVSITRGSPCKEAKAIVIALENPLKWEATPLRPRGPNWSLQDHVVSPWRFLSLRPWSRKSCTTLQARNQELPWLNLSAGEFVQFEISTPSGMVGLNISCQMLWLEAVSCNLQPNAPQWQRPHGSWASLCRTKRSVEKSPDVGVPNITATTAICICCLWLGLFCKSRFTRNSEPRIAKNIYREVL